MYRIDDKAAAIREIQRYLYEIHKSEWLDIPRVPIDGIYGNDTRAAVLELQRLKGIQPSGVVDYETFNAIYKERIFATRLSDSDSQYLLTGAPFPFKVGDSGEDIEIIHLIFRELSGYYKDLPIPRKSSYYSEESASFARGLQGVFGMPTDGEVTAEMYDRMLFELSARKRLEA